MNQVFLFGAGAILPWGGPSTTELTELVLNSGFKISDNKTTITKFIFDKLIENGHNPNDLNFETIINVIEELIVYYSNFDNRKQSPSILSSFFSSSFEKEFLNFSIVGGVRKHNFKLEIPKGKEYNFSNLAQHNETPEQFFFQHLLAEILTSINVCIEKYAHHQDKHSKIDKNSILSENFKFWMKRLARKGSLRMYTLNYDRVFKVLLEDSNLPVFEGYNCGAIVPYGKVLRANVPKILNDFTSNVHYNLHGSSFWNVEALDSEQLPNPEFFLQGRVALPCNYDFASFQLEKGRTMMLSNIVTGYQKAQKSFITPFKQMHSAFDRDCCFAKHLYIIGYSFGDEHINESIKTAIRHNRELKITIVDPSFTRGNIDFEVAIKIFSFKGNPFANLKPRTVAKDYHTFFDGEVEVHTIKFEEFLELVKNPLYSYTY